MLIIKTEPQVKKFFSRESCKRIVRGLTKKKRGPGGVTASVIRGLNILSVPHKINPLSDEIGVGDIILVNESLEALRETIHLYGGKNKLIAGPNLILTPFDDQGIICHKDIGTLLQPSEWTKDFLVSLDPKLEHKIKVWPAGVSVPEQENQKRTIDVLLYVKDKKDKKLIQESKDLLSEKGLYFEILIYGHFKQHEYFEKLNTSRMLLYLGTSESQGLALQEAWARDVPTLVLCQHSFNYKNHTFVAEKVSAPYLDGASGLFFTKENLRETFLTFWNRIHTFTPRDYVIKNLSDEVCTRKLLELLDQE